MTDLPKEWLTCKISDFSHIVMGQSPASSTYNSDGIGLPFYQGKAEFGDLYPEPIKYCKAPKKIAEKGAILLSVRAPVGPTNIAPHKSCIGRGLAGIHSLGGMPDRFILYLFRSYEPVLSGQGKGTTFKAITKDFLFDLNFALPSLPEQVRILELVEEFFSDLDNAIENLKKAQEQLKVYRQAVLKAGFEGHLTERWRSEHDEAISGWGQDNYLKTINKYSTNGRKIREKEYLPVAELPVIDQGQKLISGYTDRLNCKIECDLPVIVFGDHTKIVKFINFEFAPGADGVKVIKSDPRFRVKLFFYFTLFLAKTLPDKGYARHFQHFKEVRVPIPSLEEQDEIIKEIESRFSVCDKLEESINDNLQKAKALRQSILKQAFEGKLTEQWRKEHLDLISGENSAEALLKKIKSEKETLRVQKKR